MKIKVHAQRKFAQGAFIPPSASANPVERRVDVTPSKEENRHVYYNRMSAVSLLDIVAFQNMHSHTEPVVLLERLEEIQETISQPVAELEGAYPGPIKNAATNGTANYSNKNMPAKPLRYMRPKRTGGLKNQRAQRPQNMHLRSRLGSSFKPKSRAVKKKCREKASVGARALRRRRVPSPAESYDLDDDKPLTYIAQVLRRTVALRSDRNLRKRRGEELASTSKTTTSKVEHAGSDSDDTDTGTANGPTKPKQCNTHKLSPSNASNGFKVNEGASTSTEAFTAPFRSEVGNRPTSQLTVPRITPRARLSIQKDELKANTRSRPMQSKQELNKVNSRTRLSVQRNDLDSRGGLRARRTILSPSSTRHQTAIQINDLNQACSPTQQQSTILSSECSFRSDLQAQQTSNNNDIYVGSSVQAQSTSQNKDDEPKNILRGPLMSQMNGLKLRSSWRTQPTSQNNGLKLRSSSQTQPTQNNDLKLKNSLPDQVVIQSNDIEFKAKSQPQINAQSLEHRISSQTQPAIQNNDFDLTSSLRVQSSILSDLKNSMPAHTISQNIPKTGSRVQSMIQTNNLELRSSSRLQLTNQDKQLGLGSSSQTQPTSQNNSIRNTMLAKTTFRNNFDNTDSFSDPTTSQNNNINLRSRSRIQPTVLDIEGKPQSQPTSQNNDLDFESSRHTQSTSNNLDLISTSQIQSAIQNNDLESSLRTQPTRQGDPDVRNTSHIQITTQNSSQAQPVAQNNDHDLGSRLQARPVSLNNDLNLRNSAQGDTPTQHNDLNRRSRSRNQLPIQSNNLPQGGRQRAPPATQSVVLNPRDNAQTRPNVLNTNIGLRVNNIGRLAIQDLNVRNDLLAQLMIPNNELDLIVNPRPLSAIQNYDWNFGSLRTRPTFHNNFLGLRPDFRARPTDTNDDPQQRPNPRVELTIRNDLGGNSQALPPVRNTDVELANSTRQHNELARPTAQPTIRNNVVEPRPNTAAPSANPSNDAQTGTNPRARLPIRSVDLGFGDRGRPRPTFRSHTYNIPRSTLFNDEIRSRPRLRPSGHNNKHNLRVPLQSMRDQARYWNFEANGSDRTREQNLRAESIAATNRSARAEKTAAAADKERAMTLDEALRECVLTAQAVTAEEMKPYLEQEEEQEAREALKRRNDGTGMQRRQSIAARQQQLSEGSPPSRRNATRRISQTDTGVNGQQRVAEKEVAPPPQRAGSESEPEPHGGLELQVHREPGPSKLRRRKRTSSPGDPGSDSQTRSSVVEPEPFKESQPAPVPESTQVRSKKPTTLEDPGPSRRSADREVEAQPGPSKRRLYRRPTLLSGLMRHRLRLFECQGEMAAPTFTALDTSIAESQKRPRESSNSRHETTKDNTNSIAMSKIPPFTPNIKPPTEQEQTDIPDNQPCVVPREPIFGVGLENTTLCSADREAPHFKVPRIPASRKSMERRTVKSQGSERDDTQTGPTVEPNPVPKAEAREEEPTYLAEVTTLKKDTGTLPSRENHAEPLIQSNSCLSKHYSTVRSIVLATESELADRCGHCISCTRIEKIRKLANLVQTQRKPAAATNEVYDFDADREDSHENVRLYNFRQNRKAKLLEPANRQDAPKTPVYLDVLPPQNQHIIEITSVQMANQSKPMLRARLIRKTDANTENEFSLIEHANLLDQLLEIKIANSDQTPKKTVPVEVEEPVAGPSNAEPLQTEVMDSTDDVELNYETDDSTEFLARLQTRLNTRKKTEQMSLRAKAAEKQSLSKKAGRVEAKKSEPVKKGKGLRKGHVDTMHVELPRNYMSGNFSHCFREAPIFYPNEEEFLDPLAYFEKIYPVASHFGLCKVVAPSGFKPKCTITDDVRFNVANQYISRLYCRWGAASKEMCAIKAYLAEQKVFFTRPPLIEGIELNLPKLYRTVQRHGGLKKVIEKKRWARVAEDMRFPRGPRSAKRIDQLYVKHLLPYDTLSNAERRELMATVEYSWNRNYKKMLNRASNPLHRQKRLMGESESSDEMDTDEDANLAYALAEAEDCVVTGRCMKLSVFKKVASNVLCTLFPNSEQPTPQEVEQEYWTLVSGAAEHVCVNAASIDTGEEGYGFPRAKHDPYSRHPWNLKMFSQNSGNVLRSLGPVLGVTVPTLHLGMVFATSCWHRDPHGLPWVEYMHHGPAKIWYGIPDELSADFRKAVEKLCPTSCQNKSIWLPSDITMIPPHLLHAARVPLSRVVQNPGEFIVVCPKAYSSSIATGYTESESVYFAPAQWLTDVSDVFQELRASCEPTMFSLSQLLLSVALDARAPAHVLAGVSATLRDVVAAELGRRDALERCGIELAAPEPNRASCSQARKRPAGAWNVREQDECEICRTTLYLSKVTGLTSKRSSLCLEHALLLIDKDKKRYAQNVSGVVATIFVLRAELEDAVIRVERRLWK